MHHCWKRSIFFSIANLKTLISMCDERSLLMRICGLPCLPKCSTRNFLNVMTEFSKTVSYTKELSVVARCHEPSASHFSVHGRFKLLSFKLSLVKIFVFKPYVFRSHVCLPGLIGWRCLYNMAHVVFQPSLGDDAKVVPTGTNRHIFQDSP